MKAYYILDELLVGGEIQETSKKNIIRAITAQDMLQEVSTVEYMYTVAGGCVVLKLLS